MPSSLKKFWIEFIELYKSLPELWKQESEEYSNRHLRNKAYERMRAKLKEIDSEATIYMVKRKISNMRTAFRREYVKIKRSRQVATNPNEVYVPTLWYYHQMEFLIDEENSYDDVPNYTITASEDVYEDEDYQEYQTTEDFDETPQAMNEEQYGRTDQASALKCSWEAVYRDLDQRQQLYANRMINEILYQAALGKLQENSYKLLEISINEKHHEQIEKPIRNPDYKYNLRHSPQEMPERNPNKHMKNKRGKYSYELD
ncbi:uncharacterized protein LOC142234971 [Haematobia irritans]|uniref:uncharacterized protein LOC142234971 n=1 Tax=Haematobia irritans TaxID=7368 RepID=UPI003F50CE17